MAKPVELIFKKLTGKQILFIYFTNFLLNHGPNYWLTYG